MATRPAVPITIITGFVGTGKTTLLLNMLPQLRQIDPSYRLSLVKNEIGDLAVDTALASSTEMASSRELLGSCICCTNVGQLGTALEEILVDKPDRVVIETSGSAEPLKLVLEINRLAKETGLWTLDGVVSVVDVQNWEGYSSTSYTAKLQAKQTDLIVLNKWEQAGEERLERVRDMLGDMDVDTPVIKSEKGRVSVDLLFGLDSKMAKGMVKGDGHGHSHGPNGEHNEEMECLSVTVAGTGELDLKKFDELLRKAPKDEVYRVKAILFSKTAPPGSEGNADGSMRRYLLNWSFGRHVWTSDDAILEVGTPTLRASLFLARYESTKWTKRLTSGQYLAFVNDDTREGITVTRTL